MISPDLPTSRLPVRCANLIHGRVCNKLTVEHFDGTAFVARCHRCGGVIAVIGERTINALYARPCISSSR